MKLSILILHQKVGIKSHRELEQPRFLLSFSVNVQTPSEDARETCHAAGCLTEHDASHHEEAGVEVGHAQELQVQCKEDERVPGDVAHDALSRHTSGESGKAL